MKIVLCILPCIITVIADLIRVDANQLSSKIIGGDDTKQDKKLSFMASLQINKAHICSAGMFQEGFLISSGQCIIELQKGLEDRSKRGSVVLGYNKMEEEMRFEILCLMFHPDYNVTKKIQKIWNFDVGIVMVKVPYERINLPYAPLDPKPPDFRKPLYSELCGWGDTKDDPFDARLGSANYSKSLRCMPVHIVDPKICRKMGLNINFRNKHLCGKGFQPMQKITLGDIGSPLTMKLQEDDAYQYSIIGVACDQYQDNNKTFIRFLRISYVHDSIVTMMKTLTSLSASNADCSCSQQGLPDTLSYRMKRKARENDILPSDIS